MASKINQYNWVDKNVFPFKSNYFQTKSGKIHYVDEGEGEIILFVHGTPTWSFLYRNFISALSKEYRCIAVDNLGFGLSDKPEGFDGTPEAHANNLSQFIQELNLSNITLVVHDFGGPIGLGAAIKNHNRIKQVIMFNTWLWETKSNKGARKVDKILNSTIGKFLYLRMNFSPKVLLKKGFYGKKRLTKKVHKQYILPFPNKSSRWSLLNIGKSLVGSSSWYEQQWEQLHDLESKPWLILWGIKDEFVTLEYLEKWRQRLTNSKVVKFDCGHFVQEEKPTEAIKEIQKFLKR
ncbi:alpha/beta fold hydrolase [Flavivirga sp. 57AJ16]|uniref:alpha/beta fold hydrolase n=1 Tax=Flavivirga sp. 57AJ16 TaxID=3025307 RepID=UPI002366BE7A|nr:alpha/beta fold hydrolase [Flavivirga sp. 57AJ16]MDD7886218.1 alpha/beta fold hydrolase [Flavivirga sp. 57AJ16]